MPGDLVDLIVWREAAELAQQVVKAARHVQGPAAGAAADQLVRASESIPANIAEAYGRGFGKDGARFLRVARGSGAELESHVWLAGQVSRMPGPLAEDLLRRTRHVRALLRGLIHATARCPPRG
jgi:four helix bundle protein